jgi:hypothetical protein
MWACSKCTFVNHKGSKCDMCNTARVDATSPGRQNGAGPGADADDGGVEEGIISAAVNASLTISPSAAGKSPFRSADDADADANPEDEDKQMERALRESLSSPPPSQPFAAAAAAEKEDADVERALQESLRDSEEVPPSYTQLLERSPGGGGGGGGAAVSQQQKRLKRTSTADALLPIATEMLDRFIEHVTGNALRTELQQILTEAESLGIVGLHNQARLQRQCAHAQRP